MIENNSPESDLSALVSEALSAGHLKKLVFSKPADKSVLRAVGTAHMHRGIKTLFIETSFSDGKVSHEPIPESSVTSRVCELSLQYSQINLVCDCGQAELRRSQKGKSALIGGNALRKAISNAPADFSAALEELDRKKNYILSGGERFLHALGITDKSGRVHDKKQGKFRQINRFLEHIRDISPHMPENGRLLIYDLCCGKSYLSFAVYHYFTEIKHREVSMLCMDLKRDVIDFCSSIASSLGFNGMRFVCGDVRNTPEGETPDLVISLHACDVATDIVIDAAAKMRAGVILSTPCCHRYLSERICSPELSFVTDYPYLKRKMCDSLTDALRLMRLSAAGYDTSAAELTDPDDTPKNTLLRAVKKNVPDGELERRKERYASALRFLLGDGAEDFLKDIR